MPRITKRQLELYEGHPLYRPYINQRDQIRQLAAALDLSEQRERAAAVEIASLKRQIEQLRAEVFNATAPSYMRR